MKKALSYQLSALRRACASVAIAAIRGILVRDQSYESGANLLRAKSQELRAGVNHV